MIYHMLLLNSKQRLKQMMVVLEFFLDMKEKALFS